MASASLRRQRQDPDLEQDRVEDAQQEDTQNPCQPQHNPNDPQGDLQRRAVALAREDEQVNRHDLRKVLARHLKKLPDAQSKAIRLAYLESKSQREISQLTGAPLGTVKTRIELGMKKLSESFSGMRAKVL